MKLGILQTDRVRKELVGEFGEYPQMFARLFHKVDPTIEIVPFDVQVGEYPTDIDEVDAYLITGSVSSVYEDKQWIKDLGAFVQKLHKHKKKTIGICFGHQLIAHFLGGKTQKSERNWSIGSYTHQLKQTGDSFYGFDEGFRILFSNKDEVVKVAEGSEVIGSTSNCPIAVCKIENHFLTIQGHPEFEKGYARGLMDMRRSLFGEETYQAGIESLNEEIDGVRVAKWMIDFMHA